MNLSSIRRSLLTFLLSLSLIIASRLDLGLPGLAVFLLTFTALIFGELFIIRSALLSVYAEAIANNKFLLFFLKHKLINGVLTLFISVYFAVHLLLFANLSHIHELLFIGVCGLILMVITPSIVEPMIKPGAAKTFGRVAVISIYVLLAIIVDGVYSIHRPIDPRIAGPLDENIPNYVIEDVHHSVLYFQHLLRSVKFFNMNIDSLELCTQSDPFNLCAKITPWFHVARFIYSLSPTPFIAIALVLLSIISILRNTVAQERP